MSKATRSARNWQQPPGSLDSVNARRLFESNNSFGIPTLADNFQTDLIEQPPVRLIPYRAKIGSETSEKKSFLASTGLHFFVEDYRAESVWTRPLRSVGLVRRFGTVLSPDFSLYRDWPAAIQIWNCYRSRWCAAWWQSHNIKVVPSVAWAGPASYSFCFLGIPRGSVVAISTVGLGRDREAWRLFQLGFEAMLDRVSPALILCHGGKLPSESWRLAEETNCKIKEYDPLWVGVGQERRANFYPDQITSEQSQGAADGW